MRYCGKCGSQLEPFIEDGRERRRCPDCGWVWLGSPAPVVLVLAVSEDGRILYTRRRTWPKGAWALVAGFVETGETAEQACLREVREEAGIQATDPLYLGSLSWMDQLLLCFRVKLMPGPVLPGSDADEVELAPPQLERIPANWPAHRPVEQHLRRRVSGPSA
ncbi:MAG: NUDIX domain-containing protein [Limnochordaceae bacterium]|nr:NUDIX domain-containing protein [Limnochordaceae bacterium]